MLTGPFCPETLAYTGEMARSRRRMAARGEETYRSRHIGDATFFTSRRAFDDLTVVVKRFPGRAGGPAFVLVHGIGVSSRYFHPAAAELATRGAVYLVDLPGYGAAPDPRREVTIADHAAVLARVLEDSRLVNPVIVGHSMGAQVVSRLAVDSPEVTDRVVLMAPTMPANERSLPRAAWLLLVDGLRNPLKANLVVAWDYFIRCGMPYFLRQCRHLFGDRIEDRLAQITAATLVVGGDKDLVVPPTWVRFVAAQIPGARLHLVHGPHLFMYSDPVGVATAIAEHARR
jgi:pimeloyl-ACP methyl ester carboxylesterase